MHEVIFEVVLGKTSLYAISTLVLLGRKVCSARLLTLSRFLG